MCNTTRNPFNRAYIKKLPPPEGTFPDERPHILGTPRPYRTLFCCQSKIVPKKQYYLILTRATIFILGITPHIYDIYGYRWRRHPAILNDAAIAYTTTRLKISPYGTCKNRVLEDGIAILNRWGEATPSTHRYIITSVGAYNDAPSK